VGGREMGKLLLRALILVLELNLLEFAIAGTL
jgi:hypothetical protein